MPRLFFRLALVTRLRKRAGAKRTTNPDAVPLPLPIGSIPGTGSAHLDAPQQLDGVDELDEPVESAISTATATSSISNSPSNMAVAQVTTLEALPAELRRHILSHLTDDLADLRAFVLASPVFYQQYLLDRKALLSAGLKTALDNLLVDAYAVQASAPLYDSAADSRHAHVQPETIRLFIDNYVALRLSATPDAILEECCTEEDLLGMAAFYYSLARPLSVECAIRFLNRLDTSLEVGNLSATESSRLLRALYRWQLYCNLFGQGPNGRRKVPQLGHGEHLDVFFCIFRPWEIEEIYCIYVLLRDTYGDVLDAIAWDLHKDHPKFQDWPNPLPPGTWDLENSSIRESVMEGTSMRGLLPFADTVREDEHDELVELMQYYLVHGDEVTEHVFSWTNQFFRRERHPLEDDRMEARRVRFPFSGDAEDGPPLAWVIYWRGRYSNRYGGAIQASLQTWGYVFWDGKRLIKIKGTEEVLREREHHRQW